MSRGRHEHDTVSTPPHGASRTTYRHGDLREGLVEAGMELARSGGPDAVVLREATRRTGVSPNAAYRHFADRAALVDAVTSRAQALAASEIEIDWAAVATDTDAATRARGHLRAVGTGYLRFARDQPGLFRAAFSVPRDLHQAFNPESAGPGGLTPFGLLAASLDELLDAGVLAPERRQGAEFLAWSAVHGFSMLILEGPLRDLDENTVAVVGGRLIAMVEDGL